MPNLVQPTPLKSAVSDYDGRLQISIPLTSYGLALVVAYWLVGWTFGGISIIKEFLQKPSLFAGSVSGWYQSQWPSIFFG